MLTSTSNNIKIYIIKPIKIGEEEIDKDIPKNKIKNIKHILFFKIFKTIRTYVEPQREYQHIPKWMKSYRLHSLCAMQ